MKRNVIFHILFFSILIYTGFAQTQNPNVLLSGSISKFNCEQLLANLDSHALTVYDTPGAVGYVVLYGGSNPIKNGAWERAIVSYRNYRKIDHDRFIVLAAERGKEIKIDFWLSKNGEKPQIKEEKHDLAINSAEPILFASDTLEATTVEGKSFFVTYSDECIQGINLYFLAEVLKANPRLHAKFSIHNRSAKGADKLAKIILNEAINEAKIDSKRLITTYAGKNSDGDARLPGISDVEVWLVRN